VDFVVFENAFTVGDETFAEPARVLVSDDGVDWYGQPCEPTGTGEWPPPRGCAGVEPVTATDAASAIDPDASGGDAFYLADLGLARAKYVRLVDVTREHYGDERWCAGAGGGFDLDAVAGYGVSE
jgi:hypothetical protein